MTLTSIQAELNVFKQGDTGNLFYIVLRGEVDVFVSHMGMQFKAVTLPAGGSFGERALLTSEPRAATVTCVQDSDFLVISKRDYLRVLREVHEREFSQKILFLKTVRYFEDLPTKIIEDIAAKFTKKRFGSNELIVKEGERRTHLYIIRNGECRTLKRIIFPTTDLENGGKTKKVVQMETRNLTCRDFFGEENGQFNMNSVLSKSFAEMYCVHINDLKNREHQELQVCVASMRNFSTKFAKFNDESELIRMFKVQDNWEAKKKAVLKEFQEK